MKHVTFTVQENSNFFKNWIGGFLEDLKLRNILSSLTYGSQFRFV